MTNGVFTAQPRELRPETGLEREDRAKLAKRLSSVLADTYSLYVKTQGFHWNVTGPLFYSLHKMTEEQYEDLAAAIDDLAERIRAIGFSAPASYSQFSAMTEIKEESQVPTAEEMIKQLIEGNETCARTLREAVREAESVKDVKTADLLTERIGRHEEVVWMLRALIV